MKLLLDQGLPCSAAEILRASGIDSVHTAEIGLATAKDEEIISRARAENRVIATLDADFHALLAHEGARAPSVIRIRIERLRGDQAAALLLKVIEKCEEDLVAGAALSVDEKRIRVKRMPLVG